MPTIDDVKHAIKQFDKENASIEWLLAELFNNFPLNTVYSEVLLKVKVLNLLYSTRIGDVNTVAHHITNLEDLDSEIANGLPDAVHRIADVTLRGRKYWFLSFAAKYCSWHNSRDFPIYDANVNESLWFYKGHESVRFSMSFRRQDLWDYFKFKEIVIAFRSAYGLDSFTFKELDQFLFYRGEELLSKRKLKAKSAD